ncbi:uncharacterized protein SPSK_05613 [Sporothrix schenckii 1099-18]|uniref:Uncharacterized protein n=1 Tax=Sporothrix schenckii 1099-18 TaxID=1397361 RepID=A0A0F2LXG0_SPOSC|nr:uncharacterized protein SPSK_05613 [Sporothrix schenckii 1099-18]KJR80581.1 hypothetical protein SPSK_05613 [Sporothrix schenckii 1099-18]
MRNDISAVKFDATGSDGPQNVDQTSVNSPVTSSFLGLSMALIGAVYLILLLCLVLLTHSLQECEIATQPLWPMDQRPVKKIASYKCFAPVFRFYYSQRVLPWNLGRNAVLADEPHSLNAGIVLCLRRIAYAVQHAFSLPAFLSYYSYGRMP